MSEAKVDAREVTRLFDVNGIEFRALEHLNLEVRDGEFLCVVGPSGCGKSTLLRMFGGLDAPTAGQITLRWDDTSRPATAMIFQQESVFPWLTVERNALYGIKAAGNYRGKESDRQADHYLERAGLLAFRKFYPHQLSGGMKQRLSVARAFVTNPEILLMDEPFAALDEQNKMLLQQTLGELWEECRSTVVFITHGLEEAVLLGDRVAVMTSAPGRIKHIFPVPFERPRNLIELRRTPEFNDLTRQIWELLREEVDLARAAEIRKLKRMEANHD